MAARAALHPRGLPARRVQHPPRAATTLATVLVMLAGAATLGAQRIGEYSFRTLPDGSPQFTQTLRWQADPNVLFYEVTVQTVDGQTVSVTRLEEPLLTLDLRPGEYRYRMVLYNLLGKPEVELPWKSFTVRRAQTPKVAELTPSAWFLEDLVPRITIAGEGLEPGATILLSHTAAGGQPIAGVEQAREGSGLVEVAFSPDLVVAGGYNLVITNPGGLSVTVPGAVVVRYERMVDVLVAGGYAPWVPLYDAWYTQTWPHASPLSAFARLSVYFLKRRFGYIGAQVEAAGRLAWSGDQGATLQSQVGQTGIGALYKYPFTPRFSGMAGIGLGVAFSHHAFDYEGNTGAEISSVDLYVSAGLSLQYYFTKRFYLQAGADWMHVFARQVSEGGLLPFVCAGYQF